MGKEVHKDVLHSTYKELLEIIGDEATVLAVWEHMGGQQVNMPEHLYDKALVEQRLIEKIRRDGELDVLAEAERYQYSRRWVRSVIRKANKSPE